MDYDVEDIEKFVHILQGFASGNSAGRELFLAASEIGRLAIVNSPELRRALCKAAFILEKEGFLAHILASNHIETEQRNWIAQQVNYSLDPNIPEQKACLNYWLGMLTYIQATRPELDELFRPRIESAINQIYFFFNLGGAFTDESFDVFKRQYFSLYFEICLLGEVI
ncbi:MAG: hypothetical protein S4CHLAM102_14130 [Chlamydiia bacterium]|nr:hypothetical protein [Chlamydiia bacterium]